MWIKLRERKRCIQHRCCTFDQYSDRFPEATLVIVLTGHICRQHGCSRVGNFSVSLPTGVRYGRLSRCWCSRIVSLGLRALITLQFAVCFQAVEWVSGVALCYRVWSTLCICSWLTSLALKLIRFEGRVCRLKLCQTFGFCYKSVFNLVLLIQPHPRHRNPRRKQPGPARAAAWSGAD